MPTGAYAIPGRRPLLRNVFGRILPRPPRWSQKCCIYPFGKTRPTMRKKTFAAGGASLDSASQVMAEPAATVSRELSLLTVVLKVNGREHKLEIEPRVTLLDAI